MHLVCVDTCFIKLYQFIVFIPINIHIFTLRGVGGGEDSFPFPHLENTLYMEVHVHH